MAVRKRDSSVSTLKKACATKVPELLHPESSSRTTKALSKNHEETSVPPSHVPVSRRTDIDETYSSKAGTVNTTEEWLRRQKVLEDVITSASRYKPFRAQQRRVRSSKGLHPIYLPSSPIGRLYELQKSVHQADYPHHLAKTAEEAKYLKAAGKLFQARHAIISGNTVANDSKEAVTWEAGVLSNFWLKVLVQNESTAGLIQKGDIPSLAYLSDIRCVHENLGFTLEFQFSENPFLANSVLKKSYQLAKSTPDACSGLSFPGCMLSSCSGTKICWTSNAKTKRARPGASFYDFFQPSVTSWQQIEDAPKPVQLTMRATFLSDFELAYVIRMSIIPSAVGLFDEWLINAEESLCLGYADAATALIASLRATPKESSHTKGRTKLVKKSSKKVVDRELDLHVRLALKKAGYKIRHGRAYAVGEDTTSGESANGSATSSNEEKDAPVQKNFRGLLETNTVPRHRNHRGIRLKELRKLADQPTSGDDVADLFDLQSESESESLDFFSDTESDVQALSGKGFKKPVQKVVAKKGKLLDKAKSKANKE